VGGAVGFGHQQADIAAQEFGAGIAEQPLRRRIDALHESVGVDDGNGVDSRIQGRFSHRSVEGYRLVAGSRRGRHSVFHQIELDSIAL
jgi:hypothetical protein